VSNPEKIQPTAATADPEEQRFYERLGARIKAAREQAGLTQGELGARLRVTHATVNRWEAGSRQVGVWELRAVSRVTKVSLEQLIGDEVAVLDDMLARVANDLDTQHRRALIQFGVLLKDLQKGKSRSASSLGDLASHLTAKLPSLE
jgi:transcriptional regulator with XRE-family HTH domain